MFILGKRDLGPGWVKAVSLWSVFLFFPSTSNLEILDARGTAANQT